MKKDIISYKFYREHNRIHKQLVNNNILIGYSYCKIPDTEYIIKLTDFKMFSTIEMKSFQHY